MDAMHNQVLSPASVGELLSAWNRFPEAVLYAGGTDLLRGQGARTLDLPANLICLARIEELRRITRTERYLEIGAAVTLNEVLALGKILPEALALALADTAAPQIRNLATIGGNLCCRHRRRDATAPLVALDARYELRSAAGSRWIAAGRFSPENEAINLGPQELLTRIRIPLEGWNYTLHRKFGRHGLGDGGVVSFIARAQKDILSEVRLVFAGQTLIRDRSIETSLAGKTLPLHPREAAVFLDRWKVRLAETPYPTDLLRDQLLNFIDVAIRGLAE